METQMPEERQMEQLFNLLEGNKIFAKLRGNLGSSFVEVMTGCDAENPTQFRTQFDQLCADARVMGNLLAKLKRDGHTVAHSELEKALRKSHHTMKYELVPIHETVPVTLVMPDPDKTLLLIRWVLQTGARSFDSSPDGTSLFDVFPTLEQRIQERLPYRYVGTDLIQALNDEVLDISDRLGDKYCELEFKHGQNISSIEFWGARVAYAVVEDQKTVLKRFNRSEQKRLATWQCNIPKRDSVLQNNLEHSAFGLHDESVHEDCAMADSWQMSIGLQHGFGARWSDLDGYPDYRPYKDGVPPADEVFRFLMVQKR